MSTIQLGWYFENIAKGYLVHNGYQIIEHNFHGQYGELDIVAYLNYEYIFIEVKSVTVESEYSIYQSLTKLKLLKLNKTAQYWLRQKSLENSIYRIEFIGIVDSKDKYFLEHFKHIEFI